MATKQTHEEEIEDFVPEYRVEGGEKASLPESENTIYPKGVDPGIAREDVTSRGDYSPYSQRQRKVAAILARKFQNEQNMSLSEALNEAFKQVGDPENLDLEEFKKIKKTVPTIHRKRGDVTH